MRLPPEPKFLPRQRYLRRFWKTEIMLECLCLHYEGPPTSHYPHSGVYRMLIAIHRHQHSTSMTRKGYGPDWKGLRRTIDSNGQIRWVVEEGSLSIKRELLGYTLKGRLPLVALQIAGEHMHRMQMETWALVRAKQNIEKKEKRKTPFSIAAE